MFFQPRYLKHAKHTLHAARRIVHYRRDLLKPEELVSLEQQIDALSIGIRKRDRSLVESNIASLEAVAGRVAPPPRNAGWRENCEVFIVAILIAAGIRAYFVQPFKIPTGSMQPTLYGIVGEPSNASAPNPLVRAFDFVVRGRNFIDTEARQDDVIVALEEQQFLNYFTFTHVIGEQASYRIFAPRDTLMRDFQVVPGRILKKGETIARGFVTNGDFVFVDKMSYSFIHPRRGNVFVFKTTGITRIEATLDPRFGSQYYIKRLAGLPSDTLRIAAPNLYINGALAKEPMFEEVMLAQGGYRGYSNPSFGAIYLTDPNDTFTVPPAAYFALGDNSYNSSDSRYWGIVPQQNVTGRGLFVFWPFSERWGFIR